MPINFQEIFNNLKQGVSSLAETSLKDFVLQAKSDGQKILDSMKAKLEKWSNQLANGELSPEDFKELILGQKDLLEMVALKEAGLLLISAEAFKNSVLNLIITSITSAIKL